MRPQVGRNGTPRQMGLYSTITTTNITSRAAWSHRQPLAYPALAGKPAGGTLDNRNPAGI